MYNILVGEFDGELLSGLRFIVRVEMLVRVSCDGLINCMLFVLGNRLSEIGVLLLFSIIYNL